MDFSNTFDGSLNIDKIQRLRRSIRSQSRKTNKRQQQLIHIIIYLSAMLMPKSQ
jgi:hypothetical protein